MLHDLIFLPTPRQITVSDVSHEAPVSGVICLETPSLQENLLAAQQLQETVNAIPGLHWEIVGGTSIPDDQIRAVLSLTANATSHPQGYQLTVAGGRIHIVASTAAGLFYGVQTARQLLMQCGRHLPDVRCTDWPDFPNRGLMLDVSRDKAPTMSTLFELVEMLASWKVNQLQLYFEHMFAYHQHPTVWQDDSPFTAEEIIALDRFCRERFIELTPNQNSFGHLTHWLTRPEYNHLAEAPEGCDTIWGFRPAFSLQPTEESLRFLRTLYDELLPNFSSRQFNVGCDETIDLGKVRNKARAEEVGIGRLYIDFLKQIHREVRARGYTMQFWGDIITHYPELVRELPRDAVALEWGYEADHPFDAHGALFAASGIPFYVCPGTSTWNSIVGRTTNAIENIRNAAHNGLKHGAVGFLNTEWGDNGHWQPLPVSYLGLAAGAAYGWALDANGLLPLPDALSRFAFRDTTGIMGRLAYDLGDIYRLADIPMHNASVLFRVLQSSPSSLIEWLRNNKITDPAPRLRAVLEAIEGLMGNLPHADMQRADAELIKREFTWGANMLRHACWRAIWMLGLERDAGSDPLRQWLLQEADKLLPEFAAIWRARNREGGFTRSMARLEKMRADYLVEESK
jgi:hexosaminidase